MCLTSQELLIIKALYDCNRIPLWILTKDFKVLHSFFSSLNEEVCDSLKHHMITIASQCENVDFDILSYENEIYYLFSFIRADHTYYLAAGPMLLSGYYQITSMRNLSFAANLPAAKLRLLVSLLPVVSFSSFCSYLRIMMLLLKGTALTVDELHNYKISDTKGNVTCRFIHELFNHMDETRSHTPYAEEVAVLNCVKEGNADRLITTYKTLPETIYGNMSDNPLKQLFYGCIANTTLVTRYAIEGGLEEEAAFTLSDVYINQMEKCKTLYELNLLNEKMALDFTARVAQAKLQKQPAYTKPVSFCIDYISRNIYSKITLASLANEAGLTPKYLSFLFHKETGQTLTSFIEKKRIEEAKNLLRYSDYSYNNISQYLGFSSQSYFIMVFKRNTGLTPKEYREGEPS